MSEHILFHDIDEPGLNTLEVYERRGGYESLRKAMAMQPQQITDELLASNVRGRGGAGLRHGPQGLVHAGRDDGQVPRVQRGRVRARARSRTASSSRRRRTR